jgi:hypothetical protein
MLESLASCFAFRCSALLNSPQDESAVADMTAQVRMNSTETEHSQVKKCSEPVQEAGAVLPFL